MGNQLIVLAGVWRGWGSEIAERFSVLYYLSFPHRPLV